MKRTQVGERGARTAWPPPDRPAGDFPPAARPAATVIRSAVPADPITVIRPAVPADPITVIRPAVPADLAALGDFFSGLSARTRYLRFFGPVTPTTALLGRLSGGVAGVDAVVAVRDGVIIGHAMASDREGSGEGPEARVTDVAVVVADCWQSRGVGAALMRALIRRAQDRGLTSMAMDVLHENYRVLAMVTGHWAAAGIGRYPDCVTVEVRLPRHRP